MSRLLLAAIVSSVFLSAQQPAPAPTTSLEGRVTDTLGRPVAKVGLSLSTAANGGAPYTTTSDAEGRFAFHGIAPGDYRLAADRAGYLRALYRNGPRETFSTIPVAAGQQLSGIDIELPRAVTISGKVLDENGDPVANVPVRLERQRSATIAYPVEEHKTSTDESGKYSIAGLADGDYYLSAGEPGPAFRVLGMRVAGGLASITPGQIAAAPIYYATTYYPRVRERALATMIPIVAGQGDREGMDIHLIGTGAFAVRGKITGSTPGYPLEQCRVTLATPELPLAMGYGVKGAGGQIAKDGSIEFERWRFPPGEYVLVVSSNVRGRPIILARQTVTVRDQDLDDAVVNLQPTVDLAGSIALEGEQQTDFRPLFAARPAQVTMQVSLFAEDSPGVGDLRAKVEDDGSFRIAGIPEGTYVVQISAPPDGTWAKSIRLGGQEAQNGKLRVSAADAGPLRITLSRSTGQITGLVETEAGAQALPGSTVTLVGDRIRVSSGVGDKGRFVVGRIPPGTYRLYAWEDIADANAFSQGLATARESAGVRVVVGENGQEQVTLKAIPSTHRLR